MSSTVIEVTGVTPYDVVVGHALSAVVADAVSTAPMVAVLTDPAVAAAGEQIAGTLEQRGQTVTRLPLPAGEAAKSIGVVQQLWAAFGAARLGRDGAVVAVGGGAVTDVAGFAAATWLRGVSVVHVPTSLLGAVDAAVGGKTGINTAEGKNLVGAFHPPARVVVDLELLASLPVREWVNGLAEVVKAGFIADPQLLSLLEADPAAAAAGAAWPGAREAIERAIRVKADVVSRDLTEAGPREALNYGHTLGHALERQSGYRLPHGHGVAIGMTFVAEVARRSGLLDDATAARHAHLLAALGLPVRAPEPAAWPDLLAGMYGDKKARGGRLRLVVLKGLAAPTILDGPDVALLEAAYATIAV